jgi:hypothetical protein
VTAQEPDEVVLGGRRFAITAVDGAGLFDPAGHGLRPGPTSTACYRGFVCRYRVRDGELTLDALQIGSAEPPGPLCGIGPRPDRYQGTWRYHPLAIPVGFTGRLLVGRGYVATGNHLNMGFWPAWMYAEVEELTFADGMLAATVDRSAELAAVREEGGASLASPAPGESGRDWVSRTFSLTFEYSWPGHD